MRKRHAEGVRVVTTLRLLPTIKEAVEAAAAKNGRSLAQEVEDRLRASFEIATVDELLAAQTAILMDIQDRIAGGR